jgi:hypothetical protein
MNLFYKGFSQENSIKEALYGAQNQMHLKYVNEADLWGGFVLLR